MNYRRLGRTGIDVSEIGFGAWGIGGGWGGRDDAEALRALQRAIELGITFVDTALVYGDGHSEQLIGEAVKGRRDAVVLATKIPPRTYRWPVREDEPVANTFPAEWIIECTEQSLRNLGVDCIDLQQLHACSPTMASQLEWHEALVRLKEQGKIRAFGVSANDWDPYGPVPVVEAGLVDAVQVIYNIFEQRPAERLLPVAEQNAVGVIVRVPFEEGLLTGTMGPDYQFEEGDWRAAWLSEQRLQQVAARVERLRRFTCPECPTMAALALKFCLGHPAVSTVIPGMRRVQHVAANAAVSDLGPLPEHVLAELRDDAFVHGWSYPWSQESEG